MATRFVTTQLDLSDGMNTLADMINMQVGATTSNSAASPQTMTAAQALAGVYKQTTAGAFSLTLPSAASVVAAIPNCQVGSKFMLAIINTGSGTLTLTAGSGNTLGGQATATLATATSNLFIAEVTNATASSEAVTYHVLLKTAS